MARFQHLYRNLTPAQMDQICNLISSGRATVEAAFGKVARCSRWAVYRSRKVAEAAEAKFEDGGELNLDEQDALLFGQRLREAESNRHINLTSHALGFKKDGSRSNKEESSNAMTILRLSSSEYRTPYRSQEEQALDTPQRVEITSRQMSDDEIRQRMDAIALTLSPVTPPADD